MKRRRLSLEERAQLREERVQRRRTLLDQAEQRRRDIAQVGRDIAALAFGPEEEPRQERLDAQIARLDAALAATQLARLLVEADDPKQTEGLIEQFQGAIGRWKRSSEGWWEARIVWRPRLIIMRDPQTKKVDLAVVLRPFGPYFYRHWRQEGQQHTQYLGREMPEGFPSDLEVPEVLSDQAVHPASVLTREAIALAERLAGLHNEEADKQHRDRLYRVLKVASRRSERRLRRDAQSEL